jgi:hypothetical protein
MTFQLITLYLPGAEIELILRSLDARQFAIKAVQGRTLTNFDLAINHIERAATGGVFLRSVFRIIEAEFYGDFRSLFLIAKNYRPIENTINYLNKYRPSLRTVIATDREVQGRIEELRYVVNPVVEGVRIITRRYAKNLVGIKSYASFVSNFRENFSGKFRLEIENVQIVLKVVRTIWRFMGERKDNDVAARGKIVINQIVRELDDGHFKSLCCDLRFLEELERMDSDLYQYVSDKCRVVF